MSGDMGTPVGTQTSYYVSGRPMSWGAITDEIRHRQTQMHRTVAEMARVQDHYNGDYVIPWIENAELGDDWPSLAPSLVADAVDNLAMRASSMFPDIHCPAIDWAKQSGVRSREYARIRERMLQYSYHSSRLQLGWYSIFRQLVAYATCCLIVRPGGEGYEDVPVIEIRDALTSYPNRLAAHDFSDVVNVAFVKARSAEWILKYYPEASTDRGGIVNPVPSDYDRMWDLAEWVDGDQTVFGLLGPRYDDESTWNQTRSAQTGQELARWDNRTNGKCPVINLGRPTIGRVISQVAKAIGRAELIDRMSVLETMAAEKAIFPDTYIVSGQNQQASIRGNQWKDGRYGEPNFVDGADTIGTLNVPPDFGSKSTIDRLERNFRVSTGLIPQYGGETYGAMRTGRAQDALMGAAMDPRIQELQTTTETWLPTLNEIIFETYKGWWGNKTYHVFSGSFSDNAEVEFKPNTHVETTASLCSYPIAGADVQETSIALGQLLGVGAISKKYFRKRHPWIQNDDMMNEEIQEETLEEAAFQSLIQRAMTGELPVTYLAMVEKHLRTQTEGKDIFNAILKADEEIRRQQATEAPLPEPGQVAAPEQQLGIEAGPAGVAQPPPPDTTGLGPPPQGAQDLQALLSALGGQ